MTPRSAEHGTHHLDAVYDAVLFDMDGVLAEVSESYRAAIQAPAASSGVEQPVGDVPWRRHGAGGAGERRRGGPRVQPHLRR